MKKLLASVLICFGMFSFVQAQLNGTTYKVTKETTQAEFDKTCKENPQITEIKYYNTQQINLNNLNSISNLKELKTLYLKNIELSTPLDFSLLKNLVSLEKIFLQKIDITNTDGFVHASLNKLTLNDCEINSLEILNGTPNITRLVLEGSTLNKVSDFTPINKLQNLEWLEIINSSKPNNDNLKALSGMQNLKRLFLFKLDQITNINFLKNCANIEELSIVKCNSFSDISIISTFTKLKQLDIAYTKTTSIADLEGLEKLATLNIKETDISDIRPLAKCPAFKGGHFGEKVTDISPLQKCAVLVSVSFPKKNQAILQNQLSELRKTKPSLKSRFY